MTNKKLFLSIFLIQVFFIAVIAVAFAVCSGYVLTPSIASEVPVRPVLRDVGGQTPANTVKGEYVTGKVLTGLKYDYEPTVVSTYYVPTVVPRIEYPFFPAGRLIAF